MDKKIIVASGNKGKIKEISKILGNKNVIGYKDLGFDFEIEEDGKTFYENALIKAKAVSNATNQIAIADDSGLVVEVLNGEPGIYSARYANTGKDEDNINKLLLNLKDKKNRNAKFVCCMVIYYPNGKIIVGNGETYGKILTEKHGNNGFGYDPVFFSTELNKAFGECTEEEKNSVSHRYKALKQIKEYLE